MEFDDSFETWLHDLEMKVDPCALFPEFCREKMSSSPSSSLDVEIITNQKQTTDHHHYADQTLYHQTETSSITPLSFSEASQLDGNLHVDAEKILSARKNCMTYKIEFDTAMNKGQLEGDMWLRRSKKTALPLPQHIAVERKRRRELNQRFLALSKVVPGNNKKKDRASILGEAVKYMTDLQERIKKLEEKTKKKVVESVVFVKTSSSSSSSSPSSSYSNHYYNNDEGDYCNPSYEESNTNSNKRRSVLLAEEEIEAKVIERSVLIRVHCGNHNAILPTLLSSLSELHLIVLTANALPFRNQTDITVTAQMGVNFYMKTKDIVDHLRLALPNFI